ncbi:MAG: histone deacetylase [Proteobacteria bacterium]|nr:histone deacetylase [Pseudomonadota bacterium]
MQWKIHVVDDPRYREHRAPARHPERPERLLAVGEALAEFAPQICPVEARGATDEEILRVHGRDHLRRIAEVVGQAPAHLDPDTFVSAESLDVARLAAGAVIDLARLVARGEARTGFAAVRPPGHHAEADRARGFCLFNHVAIAARALQAEDGVGKILILDWDVHHGNGTQHFFEADPSVLYVSTHQFPYYPGTGDFGEAGRDRGEGTTVNVPLPAGCGDVEYVGSFQRIVVPAVRAFEPEMILVSCGFDAHRDDPMASMEVSGEGFTAMTRIVGSLADELCGGRLAFVLEGGYSASGLREGTRAVLQTLLEDAPLPPAPIDAPAGSLLRAVVDRVAAVHRQRIPEIGAA